jgi:hypothetical protein
VIDADAATLRTALAPRSSILTTLCLWSPAQAWGRFAHRFRSRSRYGVPAIRWPAVAPRGGKDVKAGSFRKE